MPTYLDAPSRPIGHWSDDEHGLPRYHYTGDLPFRAVNSDGAPVPSPEDPWFILGNYRLTAFVHASGRLDLINGERAWGRLNRHGHGAELQVDDRVHPLTGLDSPAATSPNTSRTFGCGHAVFDYTPLDGITCSRTLAVAPSPDINQGLPALYITVLLRNPGANPAALRYREWIGAGYEPLLELRTPFSQRPARYPPVYQADDLTATLQFRAVSDDPLLFVPEGEPARHDAFPPALHLAARAGDGAAVTPFGEALPGDGHRVGLDLNLTLSPGETRSLVFLVGWFFPHQNEAPPAPADASLVDFGVDWAALIPDFEAVPDAAFRREARWNVHALEALATYSRVYDETFMPQGSIYDFGFGTNAAPRDNLQHALAACHYRPALAKSTLRHVLKRTSLTGEIYYQDYGVGTPSNVLWKTSDQQLFLFQTVAEYLRVTGDLAFLSERVPCWPAAAAPDSTVLDHLRRAFVYLRDEVGTGPHGLLRILNSDWNDAVFHVEPVNHHYWTSESHYNASMAPAAIDELLIPLRAAAAQPGFERLQTPLLALIDSMERFARAQESAFVRDLGDRPFSRRAWLADAQALGDEILYLEPQIYALRLKSLPRGRRLALWKLLRGRLGENELLGLRQLETASTHAHALSPGSHENGGIWYSLNGPLILSLADLDRDAAWELFRRMSFAHHAAVCPGNWIGHWTAPDVINGSASAFPGASSPHSPFKRFPAFCSHPHAWFVHTLVRLVSSQEFTANGPQAVSGRYG